MANVPGRRDHEHDVERAMTRGKKRRRERAGCPGRQALWSGRLRTIKRVAYTQFLFFIVFAIQPSRQDALEAVAQGVITMASLVWLTCFTEQKGKIE
jgi:hypothetical protein